VPLTRVKLPTLPVVAVWAMTQQVEASG